MANPVRITCACGSTLNLSGLYLHRKTIKHTEYMKAQQNTPYKCGETKAKMAADADDAVMRTTGISYAIDRKRIAEARLAEKDAFAAAAKAKKVRDDWIKKTTAEEVEAEKARTRELAERARVMSGLQLERIRKAAAARTAAAEEAADTEEEEEEEEEEKTELATTIETIEAEAKAAIEKINANMQARMAAAKEAAENEYNEEEEAQAEYVLAYDEYHTMRKAAGAAKAAADEAITQWKKAKQVLIEVEIRIAANRRFDREAESTDDEE
jgi:hypothetical protein